MAELESEELAVAEEDCQALIGVPLDDRVRPIRGGSDDDDDDDDDDDHGDHGEDDDNLSNQDPDSDD